MPILAAHEVTVRFGGNVAVDDVSVAIDDGTVTGLIGPNGAGKTTLFNVVSGLLEPTQGRVELAGRDITRMPSYRRARLGMARTFQRLELFTSLSVRDNIRVAGEIHNRWARRRIDVRRETERIVERLGLADLASREVGEIPTGMARRVELGRALMAKPKVLLLDEPASGQSERETEEFGELLRALAHEGIAVFLVEHDVSLVMRVCSVVHVLDFGIVIATGAPEEIQANEKVLEAYLGAEG